jgi:uncharacterized protein
MRFLLILFVVLIAAWRWRTWREAIQLKKQVADKAVPKTTNTVVCRQCGVHVAAQEAVIGTLGVYCSADHRLNMER